LGSFNGKFWLMPTSSVKRRGKDNHPRAIVMAQGCSQTAAHDRPQRLALRHSTADRCHLFRVTALNRARRPVCNFQTFGKEKIFLPLGLRSSALHYSALRSGAPLGAIRRLVTPQRGLTSASRKPNSAGSRFVCARTRSSCERILNPACLIKRQCAMDQLPAASQSPCRQPRLWAIEHEAYRSEKGRPAPLQKHAPRQGWGERSFTN
jgi:hypothetical protein